MGDEPDFPDNPEDIEGMMRFFIKYPGWSPIFGDDVKLVGYENSQILAIEELERRKAYGW
jgi:hypothetical protein